MKTAIEIVRLVILLAVVACSLCWIGSKASKGMNNWQAAEDLSWRNTYTNWCVATASSNLTYDQWQDLQNRKMLPGQNHEETTIVPVLISH